MRKPAWLLLALITFSLLTGCKEEPNIVISERTLDITVTAEKAKEFGQLLFDAVPALSDLRDKLEADTGKKIKLTISVQSSPNPEGINELEKNNYFMYVAYSDSEGLVKTYTFLIDQYSKDILVFAENGDDRISTEEWAASLGLN